MGRPKTCLGEPDVRTKLMEAVWASLETHRLSELTVSMIASAAGCNRGTLYYHFSDIDELLNAAIAREVLGDEGLVACVAWLASGAEGEPPRNISQSVPRRLALLADRGGMDLIARRLCEAGLALWERVLSRDGECVTPEARMIVQYAVSGLIGLLTSLLEHGTDDVGAVLRSPFVRHNVDFLVHELARAQSLGEEEVRARLVSARRVLCS